MNGDKLIAAYALNVYNFIEMIEDANEDLNEIDPELISYSKR